MMWDDDVIRTMFASAVHIDKHVETGLWETFKQRDLLIVYLVIVNRGQSLGRYNRIVLPRCVVAIIRHKYPDPLGQYTGFQSHIDNAS